MTGHDDPGVHRRALRAAGIGSVLEWFEFGLYAYLAPIIGAQFFPASDPVLPVLAAFAVFGLTYVARPIGGMVLGHFGDRIGRRAVLSFSVVVMGLATFAMGVLPTYDQAGLLAPALLVGCRLVQAFSSGGEQMGAASFALEHSPKPERGRASGVLSASIAGGYFLGAVLVLGLNLTLGTESMASYGWRIPFLIALPMALYGRYLRSRLSDTPEFEQIRQAKTVSSAPLREALATQSRQMLLVGMGVVPVAVGVIVLIVYIPTFLASYAGLSVPAAVASNAVALLVLMAGMVMAGRLVDRCGTWRVMSWAAVGYVVLAVPAFAVLSTGGFAAAVIGQLILVIPVALSAAALYIGLVDAFPIRVRYSAGSLTYNAVLAVFAGTAPVIATYLVATTGSPLMPGLYIAVLALAALPAIVRLRRTDAVPDPVLPRTENVQ
ncbi:MFS transporter [Pseudonocardiaceae bacterium YIM PH 21723]|nr:MFS transporter [Pseudonocardiaceae bacterium YIM PH 21723]